MSEQNHVLPSWNDGAARRSLLDFVQAVIKEDSSTFVPVAERIAVFDNDGTLWTERPIQIQLVFALDRLEEMAQHDPSLRTRQPFKAFLDRDVKAIEALGKQGAFEVALSMLAGLDTEEYVRAALRWLDRARHPQLDRLYRDCLYAPQLELLAFLREHGFKTFIVSGGGIDFMRAFALDAYGIPPEQVIGSSVKAKLELRHDDARLIKRAELGTFDDRAVKVENIGLHIGQRPILAFGNSDGDLDMMRYTLAGPGPRLALLLHHDDAEREFAYDRDFKLSPLAEALDQADSFGLTVVSMKRDWRRVFPGIEETQVSSGALRSGIPLKRASPARE